MQTTTFKNKLISPVRKTSVILCRKFKHKENKVSLNIHGKEVQQDTVEMR
jgi:hypothetical protein